MKGKIIYILTLLLLLSSCSKLDNIVNIFVDDIAGEFEDYEGDLLYLVYEDEKKGIITDTIFVEDGNFDVDLNISNTNIPLYFYNQEFKPVVTLFMKQGDKIKLSGSAQQYKTVIEGDSVNTSLGKFYNSNSTLLIKNDSLKNIYTQHLSDTTFIKEFKAVNDSVVKVTEKYVRENTKSLTSLFLIYKFIASPEHKILAKNLMEALSPEAKISNIAPRVEHFAALQKFDKGKSMPYTQLKSMKDSSLYNFTIKNRITILLFWNSNDTLSIKKLEELNSYYTKFDKDKKDDVKVHSLSLDLDKDNWLKFLKDKDYEFTHSYLPDGWSNQSTRYINLNNVPSIFLINRNGVILGRELEFDSLSYLIDAAIATNDSLDSLRKRPRKTKK